jgi:hypothetical protein
MSVIRRPPQNDSFRLLVHILNRRSGGTGGIKNYTGNIIQYYFTDYARGGGRFKGE